MARAASHLTASDEAVVLGVRWQSQGRMCVVASSVTLVELVSGERLELFDQEALLAAVRLTLRDKTGVLVQR